MARAKTLPKPISVDEQEQLINIFNTRYFNSRRNRYMIKLFLSTGLRLSEMLDLCWKDINLMTGQLKVVQGKGKRDRMLWISDTMLEELQSWREDQAKNIGVTEYVFSNRYGKRLADRDVREMVNRYSENAINKKISPHALRHSFATDLYRETKDIMLVQKALGHEYLNTTMVYTHLVDDELESALKLFRK